MGYMNEWYKYAENIINPPESPEEKAKREASEAQERLRALEVKLARLSEQVEKLSSRLLREEPPQQRTKVSTSYVCPYTGKTYDVAAE